MKFKDWFRAASELLVKPRWIHICNFVLRGAHLQMVELRIVGGRHEEDSVTIEAAPGT